MSKNSNNLQQGFRPTLLPPGVFLRDRGQNPPPQGQSAVTLKSQQTQTNQAQALYTASAFPSGPDKEVGINVTLDAGNPHIEAPEVHVDSEQTNNTFTNSIGQTSGISQTITGGTSNHSISGTTEKLVSAVANGISATAVATEQMVNEVMNTSNGINEMICGGQEMQ